MYATSVEIHGLRGADGLRLSDLERRVDIGSRVEAVAVADALDLLSAAVVPGRLARTWVALGVCASEQDVEVLQEGSLPTQASWAHGTGARALVVPHSGRRVTVAVNLELDPPMFGTLREHALRDPRLVDAFSGGSDLRVKVGWLFTKDYTTASIAILDLSLGAVSFPTGVAERPRWMPSLLRSIGERLARVVWTDSPVAVSARLAEAALSPDPQRRAAYQRAARALAQPPFGLGVLELVRVGDTVHPCFGPDLRPARAFGPTADEALRLVEAVFLAAPDILVVEGAGALQSDPQAVQQWLASYTGGDTATLEQVVLGGTSP